MASLTLQQFENFDITRFSNDDELKNFIHHFYDAHKDCFDRSTQEWNLSKWDTSNVTDMSKLFYCCSNLKKLNLNNWNTSNVTNMSYMFFSCLDLEYLECNNWNTSKVTDMSHMFEGTHSLSEIQGLKTWNTSNVKNSNLVFAGSGIFNNYTERCSDFKWINIML